MGSHKSYTTDEYIAFLSQPFSNNFGISEKDCINWFMQQNGSLPVRQYYGVNKENLANTYIPRLKEAFNGGFFLFLAITVCEGGGAGNWINHYMTDTSSGGLNTMNDDIDYIYTTFDKHFPPAVSAPEIFAPYEEDVAGETDRVYNLVPSNSLGSYYIPSTMAGNAWIFGEKWCLKYQSAAPPYVYFGNPYDDIINVIKSCGADPFGDTPAKPNPDPEVDEDNKGNQSSELDLNYQKVAKKIIDSFNNLLTKQLYNLNDNDHFTNEGLQIYKTYNNLYKAKYNLKFLDFIKSLLNTKDMDLNNSGAGQQDKEPDGSDNKPPSIDSGKDNTILNSLYKWCNERQGKSYDFDGVYGAQCVDLITTLNSEFNLGLNLSGLYAKDIYNNSLPSNWEKITGNPNNDNESKNIWNTIPNGAIVWFTNSGAGHVGVKAGDWALTLNQNVDDPAGNGGPIRKTQLKTWIESGGAGFLGAWVTK